MSVAFLAGLAAAVSIALATVGARAEEVGRGLYAHRVYLESVTLQKSIGHPLVVWMGDSTIWGLLRPSYPQLLRQRLGAQLHQHVVASLALDAYHYYFLMGRIVAMQPDLLVMVANLRLFNPRGFMFDGTPHTFMDLRSMMPAGELVPAMSLPLSDRGVSVPALLLGQVLRWEPAERALYVLEGWRSLFDEASFWTWLGPRRTARDEVARTAITPPETAFAMYDVPIYREQPVVRMLGAAVAFATAHGVRTLVIASPVPYQRMAEAGRYDARLYAQRFGVLRAVVEDNGGTFLDLHEALPPGEFSDLFGHYTDVGAEHLAEILQPIVLRTLRGGSSDGTVAAATPQGGS